MLNLLAAFIGIAAATQAAAPALVADPPKNCDACAQWNAPRAPFRVFGNTWHVGTAGLASILITSPRGHILIDGGLPQSAPLIADNIRKAGFELKDVKLILNSHTHSDHAGGIAALQRASHAEVAASPKSKRALEAGGPTEDDPQFGFGHERNDYARVSGVREIRDNETLRVGELAITAHFTPGHTPGGTSWTWRSCEGERCLDIVYADSLNPVSAPGFRFTDKAALPRSIEVVAGLPCDVLLAPHPELIGLDAKLAQWKQVSAANPFIDAGACAAYAASARARLEARIAEEGAAK